MSCKSEGRNAPENEARKSLELVNVELYEGDGDGAPGGDRTSFARGSTRYIWYRASLRHGFRHASISYKLTARLRGPDGAESDKIEDEIETNPSLLSLSRTGAWGWQEPGKWTVGTYRIEFLIDNISAESREFSIYDDRVLEDVGAFAPVTLNNAGRMGRLLAIDRRALAVLPRTRMGVADQAVLTELETIAAEYEALLAAGVTAWSLFNEHSVRGRIGDTYSSAARVANGSGARGKAEKYYRAAIEAYKLAGLTERVSRIEADLAG